jgi:hypothetical protein
VVPPGVERQGDEAFTVIGVENREVIERRPPGFAGHGRGDRPRQVLRRALTRRAAAQRFHSALISARYGGRSAWMGEACRDSRWRMRMDAHEEG